MGNNSYYLDNFNNFLLKSKELGEIVYITNIGFERRSIYPLEVLAEHDINTKFSCILCHLRLKEIDPTYKLTEKNVSDIVKKIEPKKNISLKHLLYDDKKKNFGINMLIKNIEQILNEKRNSQNIILDISGFQRSIFIPIIFYFRERPNLKNFFIVWVNKKGLNYETNVESYGNIETLPYCKTIACQDDELTFWLPILNHETFPIEKYLTQSLYNEKVFKYPLLTFPNNWIEETETILKKNSKFFHEEYFDIDNLMYIPFNNPFEVYFTIKNFIIGKRTLFKNLKEKKEIKVILTPHGSKAQSIGMALYVNENKHNSTINLCNRTLYNTDNHENFEKEISIAGIILSGKKFL